MFEWKAVVFVCLGDGSLFLFTTFVEDKVLVVDVSAKRSVSLTTIVGGRELVVLTSVGWFVKSAIFEGDV